MQVRHMCMDAGEGGVLRGWVAGGMQVRHMRMDAGEGGVLRGWVVLRGYRWGRRAPGEG